MDLSVETLMAWLEASAADPLMLGAALALATLATEDGALIAGSLLVGSGVTTPLFAISALAFGILAGDMALYGAGWSARSSSFLRKYLPVKKSRGVRRWLIGKENAILFFSRFMPGTRLVTYVTFGFLKLSFVRFAVVMTLASVLWVTGMVLFISEIQKAFAAYGTWIGAGAGVAFALGGVFLLRLYLTQKKLAPSLTEPDVPNFEFENENDSRS